MKIINYKERNEKQWATKRANGTDTWKKSKKSPPSWNKGLTKLTDDRIAQSAKKISESTRGKFVREKSHRWKGGKPDCKDCGKKLSSYKYKYCGLCVRKHYSGEEGHNWRGGLTKIGTKLRMSTEYKLWRKCILEKDGHACIWCNSKKELHVDHIKPFALFPELRLAIDNGRVLCKPCHKTTDSYCKRLKKITKQAI